MKKIWGLSLFFFICPILLFARDPFAAGKLLALNYREVGGQQILELQFDRVSGFSKAFIPMGERTKSNPQVILNFPNTKLQAGLVREHQFQKNNLVKYQLKKRVSNNGIELLAELSPSASYKIKEQGKVVWLEVGTPSKTAKPTPKVAAVPPASKAAPEAEKPLVIVLDPGHGGEDVGAIGKKGKREKDVTLAITKELAKQLRAKKYQVYLTRERDQTLTLEQRNRFAQKRQADLFISVHANASTSREVRGVQTYFLNNASDEAATRLAARENKHAGVKLPTSEQILSTMQQNDAAEESRGLAAAVQRHTLQSLRKQYSHVNDLQVRSALFYVLVGAQCPGVLVETSFISNPEEEKRLTDAKYQRLLAIGITAGVEDFLAKRAHVPQDL